MTIYMGYEGAVEIRRSVTGDNPVSGLLSPEDVNENNNTFEHPFHTPSGPAFNTELSPFISGDLVEVARTDKNPDGTPKNLVLLKNGQPSKTQGFYVSVGVDGRLQCYNTFDDAISKRNRLELVKHSEAQQVEMRPTPGVQRCLANVTSFEFTSEREAVDTSTLGTEFREYYTRGMISGQGSLECFWSYKPGMCDGTDQAFQDYPNYLIELSQRVTYGADFLGTFFLFVDSRRAVWQECQCIVQNASFAVTPNQVVSSRISFITTGPTKLCVGQPRSELLLEDGSALLQEDLTATLQEAEDD
jgi:hypothetical protein